LGDAGAAAGSSATCKVPGADPTPPSGPNPGVPVILKAVLRQRPGRDMAIRRRETPTDAAAAT
jgi:hypothetical protein